MVKLALNHNRLSFSNKPNDLQTQCFSPVANDLVEYEEISSIISTVRQKI